MTRFSLSELPLENLPPLTIPASCGAQVTFRGLVRNHNEGRTVIALDYEAYPELAISEGETILAEAVSRFGLDDARAVHRTGKLVIGEMAVMVDVLSGHRGEGFAACRWIIDQIKDRLPIWKHEHYAEGDQEWVYCRHQA